MSLICLAILAYIYYFAGIFGLIRNKLIKGRALTRNLVTLASGDSLKIQEKPSGDDDKLILKTCLSNFFDEITTQLQNNINIATRDKFIEHPGFPFSLDCNHWSSCGYNGSVVTWSCKPSIEWMSLSKLTIDKDKLNNSKVEERHVIESYEIIIWPSIQNTIPHLLIKIDSLLQLNSTYLQLCIDYIPRLDLVNNLNYFDKYYKDIQEDFNSINNSIFSDISQTVLNKIISSPCCIYKTTLESNMTIELMKELCYKHINRYQHWFKDIEFYNISNHLEYLNREESLYKLLFDDVKFSLADILGREFAPKASEITASMLGPNSIKYLI